MSSSISQSDVVDFFKQQEWEIVDMFDGDDTAVRWSVTAVTDDGIRVAIDNPIEDPRLNNIFVETFVSDVESVEEYSELVEDTPESITVEVSDEDGVFIRAKQSIDVDLTDAEIVERLDEKDVSWGVRLVAVGCTQEDSFGDVLSWVNDVRGSQ